MAPPRQLSPQHPLPLGSLPITANGPRVPLLLPHPERWPPPGTQPGGKADSSPWTSEPEPPRDRPLASLVPYCPLLYPSALLTPKTETTQEVPGPL